MQLGGGASGAGASGRSMDASRQGVPRGQPASTVSKSQTGTDQRGVARLHIDRPEILHGRSAEVRSMGRGQASASNEVDVMGPLLSRCRVASGQFLSTAWAHPHQRGALSGELTGSHTLGRSRSASSSQPPSRSAPGRCRPRDRRRRWRGSRRCRTVRQWDTGPRGSIVCAHTPRCRSRGSCRSSGGLDPDTRRKRWAWGRRRRRRLARSPWWW
jgi:hypothetical protein